MESTLELAHCVAHARLDDIPESVQDAAVRALVDAIACALGGCLDPQLDTILDALGTSRTPQQATLIGRGDSIDMLGAALLDAVAAASLDYDAIHGATLTRPSVPVAGALLPLAEARGASGTDLILAYTLGMEAACRIALALGSGHAERGWNASSTCGVIGAAVAGAKLLGLDAARTAHAVGIAATQAGGLTGISAHSAPGLDLGFAARNGLRAALLAEQGFTGSALALEGKRGLLAVLGVRPRPEAISEQWGRRWEVERITHRPYACGTLLHPAIDACLQLRHRHGLRPRAITTVDLRVHPQVLAESLGATPDTSVQARSSVTHAAAAALFDGAAGVRQFQMERVRHARLAELRSRVQVLADPDLASDEAHVTIGLQDGRTLERHQRSALGGLERPLGDADLSTKFRNLANDVLASGQAERMLALGWNIRALGDVGALIRASVPEDVLDPAELPGSPLIPR